MMFGSGDYLIYLCSKQLQNVNNTPYLQVLFRDRERIHIFNVNCQSFVKLNSTRG